MPLPLLIHAIELLNQAELVAFPTETVYGLGADARNPEAVAKIFAAKGRPADHPVIVHLPYIFQLNDWAINISDTAYQLANAFWPGPMTLILPAAANVPSIITGGQSSIGLRIPAHPVAQELLQTFGRGIAAPSANRFGRISPTTAEHVRSELGDKVKLILDGGACPVGIESTIIDLTAAKPRLLRPGSITVDDILQRTGITIIQPDAQAKKPRVSGSLESHYAPQTPLHLIQSEVLLDMLQQYPQATVMAFSAAPQDFPANRWRQMPTDAAHYAQQLYAILRELDVQSSSIILVEAPPDTRAWQAVRDRLQRAAAKC